MNPIEFFTMWIWLTTTTAAIIYALTQRLHAANATRRLHTTINATNHLYNGHHQTLENTLHNHEPAHPTTNGTR